MAQVITQAAEVFTQAAEVFAPEAEVITPATEVSSPAEEVFAPEAEVITPATEVSAPAEEVFTPEAEVVTPVTEVSSPGEEVITPAVDMITSAEAVITPAEVIMPAAEIITPTEMITPAGEVIIPAEEVITPATEVIIQAEEVTIPPVEVITPAEEVTIPPVEVIIPAEEVITPTPEVITPPAAVITPAEEVITPAAEDATAPTEECPAARDVSSQETRGRLQAPQQPGLRHPSLDRTPRREQRLSLSPNPGSRRRAGSSTDVSQGSGGDSDQESIYARLLDMPMDMRSCHTAGLLDKVKLFNQKSDAHLKSQAINPFSGEVTPRPKLNKHDKDYGRPVAGSKTALRGQKAATHLTNQMLELCNIINECGYEVDVDDPRKVISFGELFNIYTCISNIVVGLLLRARKQKLVDFEGETLFQRRDDNVAIFLMKPIAEIREHFKRMEAERKEQERLENGH